MSSSNTLGDFLRTRRAGSRPDDFGMPSGGRRRVPGLRREEVAVLAGMSTDYYVRLERGRERNPSDEVLGALGRVFGLDGDGMAYLRRLAGAIHPGLARDRNLLRSFFLDAGERDLFPQWEQAARTAVAWLRAEADPDSVRLASLVGELTLKSHDFARFWARHDVRARSTGRKTFRHPVVGEFAVDYETFRLEDGSGHTLTVYHAEPGGPDADALALLSSHAVTGRLPSQTVASRVERRPDVQV
ncbi:helix-turn-helix transcriptional regulator [Solwaraspora sp. WMMD791]|uniref:helix-turn-helix domain-containing protein n=1 Tax=Solwaraspora sp. WMMD791 TaxID=3016086 RepID=UPI00249B5075|nr:helix-turn-helix transcriptional regulator [Solwaraspora sp. WMMD791]WFE26997.1 helix-turn-helix transcriptional regulator [Solwaraspora sp. WMMD791]